MNIALKLVKVGNSTGVILPRAILNSLGAEAGDYISAAEADGAIELRPYREDFESQMTVAREVMERRKQALRELAK